MAHHNIAKMTTATLGTGTITLGAASSGFLTFALAGVVDGENVTYVIRDGANTEVGRGVYTSAGTTLTRAEIIKSTNADAAINLSGNATVSLTLEAGEMMAVALMSGGGSVDIIDGASDTVPVGTVDLDTASLGTLAGDIFTLARDGVYRITAVIFWTTITIGNPNGSLKARLTSGFNYDQPAYIPTAANVVSGYFSFSVVEELGSGDTLDLTAVNDTGVTLRFTCRALSVEKLQ
jgi:hypothetical protein